MGGQVNEQKNSETNCLRLVPPLGNIFHLSYVLLKVIML